MIEEHDMRYAVVLKSISSASENSSVTDRKASSQRPSCLHRFINEFSLARLAAVHMPNQAHRKCLAVKIQTF